jgi:hypothetical protein
MIVAPFVNLLFVALASGRPAHLSGRSLKTQAFKDLAA